MIKAMEARYRARNALTKDIDEKLSTIYESIELTSDKGKMTLWLDKPLDPESINRLRNLGYKVEAYSHPTCGWAIISWE